ncbi:MAG: PorT family protein [Bacteroidetes bacterium]|nr:PorT family protein [Bacteroidota bacterium]
MRKYLFLYGVLLFLQIDGVNAQQIWVGLKGGLSIPDISGGSDELSKGYTSRLAANFGVLSEWQLRRRLSLQVELNYAGQGGQRKGMQPITNLPPEMQALVPSGQYLYANFRNKAILDYLELPVMAKYSWGRRFPLYINAGPYVGYLLQAKEKTSGRSAIYADAQGDPLPTPQPIPPQSFDATTDVTSSIRRWNVGITGGGGVAWAITPKNRLFFDARFEYGFINIQRYRQDGSNNTGNVLLSLGYAIGI